MDVVSKSTGNSYSAAEFNQSNNELKNTITSTGQTPASGDLFQIAKAIADYSANGDFYTDSGAADAYVLSVIGSKQAPAAYTDGFRVRYLPGYVNTGASTINVAGLGVKNIKTPSGADPLAGEIPLIGITLQYDSSNGWFFIYDVATGGLTPVFSESFTSTEQTITSAGSLTLPHGLSASPSLIQCRLICKTAEFGYSIGDEVIIGATGREFYIGGDGGHTIVSDATNLNVRYGSNFDAYAILRKTSGDSETLTNANWKLVVKAWV